ncbi:M23 family metallopeptidase [Sinomonas mesophila]|uniref:M23 family metallopeptidase n=1 Tax=Sinomonas mesophila TaxID=1531955 RepID=UPI0009855634|nr:M23 family metallopeptidase [Sinomonas mesophila]
MIRNRARGRRRAAPARPFYLAAAAALANPRTQAGSLALLTGVVALGAVPAAVGADAPARTAQLQASASGAAPAAAAPVTAEPAAELSFQRPGVASTPAPPKAPAAGSVEGQSAAVQSAPAPRSALAGPLASLRVSSPFGYRYSPFGGAAEMHTGTDFAASCSTRVMAAGAGTVVEAGWHPYGGGNSIVVDHGNGLQTTYNHLASIEVSVGQAVAAGQRIAGVGTTGASTGCHLHFEVLLDGQTVDPMGFI